MSQWRLLKLEQQLKEEIATLILRGEVKDPRVSNMITINKVELSRDLKFAKVYVSSFMSEASLKTCVAGLSHAAGFIQSSIAHKLSLRQFPKLNFIADYSIKEGMAMINKINDIVAKDKALSPPSQDVAVTSPTAKPSPDATATSS